MSGLRPLRPYQARALEMTRRSIATGHRRPILWMPTGAGKTRIAAEMFRGALGKGKRGGFVVPLLALVDQALESFAREGVTDVGVLQAQHPATDAARPLQIVSAATLARRNRPAVDFLVIDEAHILHKSTLAWMRDRPDMIVVGLTATPQRPGLGRYFDDLIAPTSISELTREGYLCPLRVFAPSEIDLAGVRLSAGDYREDDVAEIVDQPTIIGDVVTNWLERGELRPTLAFCVNRRHARHVAERFEEAGIATAYVDALTERSERARILAQFRAGDVKIIVSIGTMTAGVDLPETQCIILARPTASTILHVQMLGRGLRPAPGKQNLLVFDHGAATLRLGLPEDIVVDRLDDGRERAVSRQRHAQPVALPKLCERCKAVIPPRATSCPGCGAPVRAVSLVEAADGELVEIGALRTGLRAPEIGEKARFFGELLGIARSRGYAPGWAAHQFRERYGDWPNDPRIRSAPAAAPTLKTTNWLLSRKIAFARARRTG